MKNTDAIFPCISIENAGFDNEVLFDANTPEVFMANQLLSQLVTFKRDKWYGAELSVTRILLTNIYEGFECLGYDSDDIVDKFISTISFEVKSIGTISKQIRYYLHSYYDCDPFEEHDVKNFIVDALVNALAKGCQGKYNDEGEYIPDADDLDLPFR